MNWKSHKVGIRLKGETAWTYNALRFSNEGEALAYADDLMKRWTLVRQVEVHRSEDEPNATFPVPDSTYHIPRPERLQFEPTKEHIEWARDMIANIKQGGILHYPTSDLIYVLYHNQRKLVLLNPGQLLYADSLILHFRTVETFGRLGWTVEEAG